MSAPQTPPPAPSIEDAQQVGRAATDAAVAAPTPAQARTDAAAAAQRAGEEKGIAIGDKEANAIAEAVVAAMEARGAFDAPLEAVAPPPAPAPGGDAAVAPPAGAPSAVAPEQPPAKRSFAQRFLGE